jgi:hypothetical protein
MGDPLKLYLDEDVDVLVSAVLRSRGFNVSTTLDCGNLQAPDPEQLRFAIEQGRALVTHNRADFELLAMQLFERAESHAGIIIARKRLPYEIVERLLAILGSRSGSDMVDQLLYV